MLALVVIGGGCAPRGKNSIAELLPVAVQNITIGSTVAELRKAAPATTFTPYDGLELRLGENPLGFHTAEFITGEHHPETPPEDADRIREIRMSGDSVDAGVVTRISNTLKDHRLSRRCIPSLAFDVYIWEIGGDRTNAELTVSPHSSRRAIVRFYTGKWKGDDFTTRSVEGACRR